MWMTTLNKIREHSPCSAGWSKLLEHLGKTKADDEPLPLLTVLDSNGFDDALWCLRAIDGRDREIRLFAVRCARSVQHLMADARSIDAIGVAERLANGEATQEELSAAWVAAQDAARVAVQDAARVAAQDAARAAAQDVARAAVWAAARAAAWAAAWDVAQDAARDVAWAAARAAEIEKQERDLRAMISE